MRPRGSQVMQPIRQRTTDYLWIYLQHGRKVLVPISFLFAYFYDPLDV
jgi:hypothetical protein